MSSEDFYRKLRTSTVKYDSGIDLDALLGPDKLQTYKRIVLDYTKDIYQTPNSEVKYYINMFSHDLPLPIPLTKYMTSCTVTKSINHPYDQATISLKLPASMAWSLFYDETGLPNTGQYILIKRPADKLPNKLPKSHAAEYYTEFFGVVTQIQQTLSVGGIGNIEFQEVEMHIGPWCTPMMLGQYRTSAYNIPRTVVKKVPGLSEFIIAGKDWNKFMASEIMSGAKVVDVKKSIEKLVRGLAYMRLPSSILSEPNDFLVLLYKYMSNLGFESKAAIIKFLENAGLLSGDIDVLLNGGIQDISQLGANSTARDILKDRGDRKDIYTPKGQMRLGDVIQVATTQDDIPEDSVYRNYLPTKKDAPKFANLQRLETPFFKGGSVWDLIKQTFAPDDAIIELSCVFIPDMRRKTGDHYEPPHGAAAAALGGTPTVMWRFKPLHPDLHVSKTAVNTLVKLHNKLMYSHARDFKEIQHTTYSEQNKRFQFSPKPIDKYFNYGHFIPLDNILELTTVSHETARINATYVENPILDTEDLTFTGSVLSEPVIDAYDALRHGLKMYDMNYPFQDLLKNDSSAVCEYLYLLIAKQNQYYSGQITLKGNREALQPGVWLTLGPADLIAYKEIGEIIDPLRNEPKQYDGDPGPNALKKGDPREKVIRDSLESQYIHSLSNVPDAIRLGIFVCYINDIAESVQVDPATGHVHQVQIIRFTRGSWGGLPQPLPANKVGKIGRI